MMAGNLSIEQRKWILKQYWKTENAERVRTAWVEAFNTPPPTRLTIYRIYILYTVYLLLTHLVYFNNKTLSNFNRKALKCVTCINFVSASNSCLVLQKPLIYHRP